MHRDGGFNDCAVSGDWFEQQDGTRFWQITIVSADNYRSVADRINLHCLVSGDVFQCKEASITFPGLEAVIGETITDIDPEVLKGVLDTIGAWGDEWQT
jgi:hypothetical protein